MVASKEAIVGLSFIFRDVRYHLSSILAERGYASANR